MIVVPSTGPEDWKRLLAQPELHWKAGRSAMSAALSWERASGLPTEIAGFFSPDAELLLAIPEYKVALPGGRRDSQSDIFALVRASGNTIACMVEAKVNESFGQPLEEWLRNASDGKKERLSFICGYLGLIQSSLPHTLYYQLLHRSAAAVLTARRFKTDEAAMIIQSFSPEQRWFSEFGQFAALFGKTAAIGVPMTVALPDGMHLTLGWAKGVP
jgi:hypothetical protein